MAEISIIQIKNATRSTQTEHQNILANKESYISLSINCIHDSISQKERGIKVPRHQQDSEFTTAFSRRPEKLISMRKVSTTSEVMVFSLAKCLEARGLSALSIMNVCEYTMARDETRLSNESIGLFRKMIVFAKTSLCW